MPLVRAGVARLLALVCAGALAASAYAQTGGNSQTHFSGHLKARLNLSWPDNYSVYAPLDDSSQLLDHALESRLKLERSLTDALRGEAHYELLWSGGDARRKNHQLAEYYNVSENMVQELASGGGLDDDRRLLDLTNTLADTNSRLLAHRIDRLKLTWSAPWGTVSAGRQAVTWGNGFLFNPIDLFNPFAPTDIERDYKVGDDLLSVQAYVGATGSLECLVVPRRDPDTGDLEWGSSSVAAKFHGMTGSGVLEYDLMAAWHYDEPVVGAGVSGYLGSAAWRVDGALTFPDSNGGHDTALALVANIDYSWVAFGKNMYGFVECYWNSLGYTGDYGRALFDPDLAPQLRRGEIYTLGKAYLSASLQVELHPLVNAHITAINNLHDPSGLLQPRVAWSARQNVQLTAGANIPYGSRDTEFGGYAIPGSTIANSPSATLFCWLTVYF